MKKILNSVIVGTGHFLPERVVSNDDFMGKQFYDDNGKPFDQPNEEIIGKFQQITEIEERRYIDDKMMNSDIAAIASKRAIEDWGGNAEDIDMIIAAHNFGDTTLKSGRVDIMPSLSGKVKHKLGIKNMKCIPYDMTFGCPGWVQGLILAHQMIQGGQCKNVVVVGSETLSRVVDPFDRNSMIFADGAGAVVVSAQEGEEREGILSYGTISDNDEELWYLKNDVSLNPEYIENDVMIRMAGRKIYEYALTKVPGAIKEVLDEAGLSLEDTTKLLIHQANAKMDSAILKRLKRLYKNKDIEEHDYMPMTIQKYGNSSVATVPTMYDMVLRGELDDHKIEAGDNIVFASVGAGMNVNAVVYKTPEAK